MFLDIHSSKCVKIVGNSTHICIRQGSAADLKMGRYILYFWMHFALDKLNLFPVLMY
jgi:hypothetical protein